MKTILLCLLLAFPACAGERFRTDINPALLYHQAFLLAPDLPAEDREYLYVREWRGHTLDERFGELMSRYDPTFKLFRQAAHAEVACDWGVDFTDGPEVFLPALARAKHAAQTARLRAMWHLQQGREKEARDDLLAVFALGRNLSRDRILISALVQIAIENIVVSVVAENFHRFDSETLKELADGMDASPARGRVADCVAVERYSFRDWFLRQIIRLREENPGNEAGVLEEIRATIRRTLAPERAAEFADKLIIAAGGTVDGVVQLFRDLDPWYDRVAQLLVLDCVEFDPQMRLFEEAMDQSPNPLLPQLFNAFRKCREREIGSLVRLALFRAAVEYKLHGKPGLNNAPDPCGDGPFAFRRVVIEGVDRGFELKSDYHGRGYDEVLIFVEREGPPFRLEGKNAGELLPKEDPEK